jgi:putative flippase GtrA
VVGHLDWIGPDGPADTGPTFAASVGALNGYILNRRWTFAARDTTRARLLYVAVQAVGCGLDELLVLLFYESAGIGKLGAYLVAIPPVTAVMCFANRAWTFAGNANRPFA